MKLCILLHASSYIREIYSLKYIFLLLILFHKAFVYADEFQDALRQIEHKGKNTLKGIETFGKSFAQSFGVPLPEFKYSYIFVNDAPKPILGAEFQIINFMGTRFEGKVTKHKVIAPGETSTNDFFNRQLYFKVFMCSTSNTSEIYRYGNAVQDFLKFGAVGALPGLAVAAFAGSEKALATLQKYAFLEDLVYPWPPHDKNIYFYRAYSHKGVLKGEFLDIKTFTQKFAGQFYNSTDKDIRLTFEKDMHTYTVTLEKQSFNLLNSSDLPYSIRPPSDQKKYFSFFEGSKNKPFDQYPIPSEGIAYPIPGKDGKIEHTEKWGLPKAGAPMLYTYELYRNKEGDPQLGLQALSLGWYDQPVSGRVRDINPANCHVWLKSAEQIINQEQDTSYTSRPINSLEDTWFFYKTNDQLIKQKLTPGAPVTINLIRPQISETKAQLIITSIISDKSTYDSTPIFNVLFTNNFIEKNLNASVLSSFDVNNMKDIFDQKLHSIITDKPSNLQAAIKIVDTFYPYGTGTGPFYYSIEPDVLQIDQFAHAIYFDNNWYTKDPTSGALVLKEEVYKELYEKLPQWIKLYRSNKNSATQELQNYLKTYGHASIFNNGKQELNEQGKMLLQQLLDGPISLKNYPLLRKGGVSHYIFNFGKQPENWPSEVSAQSAELTS